MVHRQATLKGKVLKYTLLPGFWPRIRDLLTSGFVHIAFLMATIYRSVRLLPPDHAYLNPANAGRYGVRHVIGEAANHLVFSRKNIDQIIIFFTILVGLGILFMQIMLFAFAIFSDQSAIAQEAVAPLKVFSRQADPAQDIAFILMDRIFGTEGIFGSCISTDIPCKDAEGNELVTIGDYPFPMHVALHTMLRFYSLGIFIISVFLIIYFVATIIGETAVTGSPFGQRFSKAWVPIRLIFFFALLVPLNLSGRNEGLNAAQLITFWTAKSASNFATNAWNNFNDNLTGTYMGEAKSLIATPNIPELGTLAQFMFVAKTCKIAEESFYVHAPDGVQAYIVRSPQFGVAASVADAIDFDSATHAAALEFSNNGIITVVFGVLDPDKKSQYRGHVKPVCGEVQLQTVAVDRPGAPKSGASRIQELYFLILQLMWRDADFTERGNCVFERVVQERHNPGCTLVPDNDFAQTKIKQWQDVLKVAIPGFIQMQKQSGEWDMTPVLREKGWGGAAIWYNLLAKMNGDVTTSIFNIPKASLYPMVMEVVAEQKRMQNETITSSTVFQPILAASQGPSFRGNDDKDIARVLSAAYDFWDEFNKQGTHFSRMDNGAVVNAMNVLMGTSGIYEMRRNTDIHPLAQLSTLGKSLMETSIRNFMVGEIGTGAGKIFGGIVGQIAETGGKFLSTIGMTTMAMSFSLFYILPMLPFIYFFFAVSGWVKSIFEAIVAMPLWALAHLSLDGDGLPGRAGVSGYYLLFEILLRPIMIVFGLLASVTIFGAMVDVLNQVFDLVVANVGGFDIEAENSSIGPSMTQWMRSPVDEFFFTAIYVVFCYMAGLGCFKLIDSIPNQIMRWMGANIKTFQEGAGDPASELSGRAYQGSLLATRQLEGGALALVM